MSDGHRLVQAMRQAGQTPQNEIVDIVVGEVTSIKPLKVKVESRELTETFLIVGPLCQETHIYTDQILAHSHTHSYTDSTINGSSTKTTGTPTTDKYDILLWRGLKVKDQVLMLKVGRGQKYYILQRQEGVISK